MDDQERNAPFIEKLPGYEKLPLISLPALDDLTQSLGSTTILSPLGAGWMRVGLALSGFKRFYQELPGQMEDLLRTINFRGATAYAPQVSASLALADDPQVSDPLERAARLVLAAHSLCLDIQNGTLSQDRLDGKPLEMGQYPNLFSTCLVLDDGKDRVFKSQRQDRIAVLVNGHTYLLTTGAPGSGVSLEQIRQGLAEIVARAGMLEDGRDGSVGYLSGCSNPTQHMIWGRIKGLPGNAHSLQAMRHTFLTVCLDLEAKPADAAECALQAQVGDPANRWYHAALQLVVCGNARAAAVMNFSAGLDGNVMMRGGGELAHRARQVQAEAGSTQALALDRLEWTIRGPGRARTRAELEAVIDRSQPYTFELEGLGRSFWRARHLPAVPVFVCALQLAVQRLSKRIESDPQVAARYAERVQRYFPSRPPPPPGPRPLAILQFVSLSQYAGLGLVQTDVSTPAVEALAAGLEENKATPAEAADLLQRALDEQRRAIQAARSSLPLSMVLAMFRSSRRGLSRAWSGAILVLSMTLFRLFKLVRTYPRGIVISHPALEPEVPVVGRPGVRLGYLRLFGLHYQVWDDRITLTWMPGITWPFSNEETTQALKAALEEISRI